VPQLELACIHRLRDANAGFGKPPEMVFPQRGVHQVEHLFPVLEALFDERAEYPVLLVDVVEKRANVPVLAETAPATPHGTATRCHVSPLV
jgi:hypothetical protein